VYGKAGREEIHENDDCGQLCIDGYGQRLIVDPGSPSMYPVDFFGEHRREYFNASARGHNVLFFGDREMRNDADAQGEILGAEFDDELGAWWRIDLTRAYDGVRSVYRTVVHLLPGFVAVLDEAELGEAESISLRWHTANRCAPDGEGRFVVEAEGVHLAGRILALGDGDITCARGEHEYRPPYDRGRMGDLLTQRRESYVEATLCSSSCRILSLFSVCSPEAEVMKWDEFQDGWQISSSDGVCRVELGDSHLSVSTETRSWQVSAE